MCIHMVSSAKSIQAVVMSSVPRGWMQSYQLPGRADSELTTSSAALARVVQQVKGGDYSLSTCKDIPGIL